MRSRASYLASVLTTVFLVPLIAATLAPRGTRASPTTRYVSTDGLCGGNSPCYSNVQAALDAATTDDEIHVATGTYTDTAGTVVEITETITLQGGWSTDFTAWDPDLYPTALDAQGQGRVVYIWGNISPTIDGFIITGGNATAETDSPRRGGGVYIEWANPTIVNSVITDNVASTSTTQVGEGGGLYVYYASYELSAPAVISGNQILSNTASTGYQGWGGGLTLKNSEATLLGNTISGNIASTADQGCGGGLDLSKSNVALDANRIISNTAPTHGGGLFLAQSTPFTVTNNIIAQNQADTAGGGIWIRGQDPFPASGALINNTIAQNNLGTGGEGVYATGLTTLTLTNNIVVSNTIGIYVVGNATATADYTLFYGNTNGNTAGSITSTHEVIGDPLFVDPAAWDYHIQVASAAINKGTFSGAPVTDFEGDPRPHDCFIDIGADESKDSNYCKRTYLPLIMKNY